MKKKSIYYSGIVIYLYRDNIKLDTTSRYTKHTHTHMQAHVCEYTHMHIPDVLMM